MPFPSLLSLRPQNQDTEIVDRNVTRHLDTLFPEGGQIQGSVLADWDIAILHYLGLDHVGHLGGSTSSV